MPTVAQSKLTPQGRSRRSLIAALERWSRENPAANAARGQAGLVAKFEREAREADPAASDGEIARRAECAYKAHMQRISLASAEARAARKGGGRG